MNAEEFKTITKAYIDGSLHEYGAAEINTDIMAEQIFAFVESYHKSAIKHLPEVGETITEDINMINYILEIDYLTTSEFCKKYKIPVPVFTGEVESSARQFLQIDAVKHRMFVEKAKELRKSERLTEVGKTKTKEEIFDSLYDFMKPFFDEVGDHCRRGHQLEGRKMSAGEVYSVLGKIKKAIAERDFAESYHRSRFEAVTDEKMDLLQYVTNLLYSAANEGPTMNSTQFDKWVDEQIGLLSEYADKSKLLNP